MIRVSVSRCVERNETIFARSIGLTRVEPRTLLENHVRLSENSADP